jgi:hypothetical protein
MVMMPPCTLLPSGAMISCGTILETPSKLLTASLLNSFAPTANSTTGAEMRVSSRFRAVTTISSISRDAVWTAGVSAAAEFGCEAPAAHTEANSHPPNFRIVVLPPMISRSIAGYLRVMSWFTRKEL